MKTLSCILNTVFLSLEIVGIYTTVFPLCIFYLTHIILFIIKLSSWHSFFLLRFKNLLDYVSHVLKICSLLTHEIYFIAAGASDFVRIIMVQKNPKKTHKSCSLMLFMQPAVHFSYLLFSSKGMTFTKG